MAHREIAPPYMPQKSPRKKLVPSPWIGVNWDTGNSYLAGLEDPYEGLESVRELVRHVHAKDISMEHSERESDHFKPA